MNTVYVVSIFISALDTAYHQKLERQSNLSEGTNVTFLCSVSYRGNWPPFLEWSRNNISIVSSNDDECNNTNYTTITSRLVIEATERLHESSFVCTVGFRQIPTGVLSNASEVPEFKCELKKERINVLCEQTDCRQFHNFLSTLP